MSRKTIRNDVILLANRRAGYSYKKYSALDKWAFESGIKECILTDIEEIGYLIARLDSQVCLILIYGGDGTNFYILNALAKHGHLKPRAGKEGVVVAPIGGGTMKRLPRFTSWNSEPMENAQKALFFFDKRRMEILSLPLLSIGFGGKNYVGVTCVLGAPVKIMKEYSRFKTTPILAAVFSAAALGAGWLNWPPYFTRLYDKFEAVVTIDGSPLASDHFFCVFADMLPRLFFYISPHRQLRKEGEFNCLAYSVGYKEIAQVFPLLAVGQPPTDPRYFNQPAKEMAVEVKETMNFSIDGEYFVLPANGRLTIKVGPSVKVLVNHTFDIPPLVKKVYNQGREIYEWRRFLWPVPKEEG